VPIAHVPPTTAAQTVAEAIARDGAVIVDGLAPLALMDRIDVELAPYLAATPTGPDAFSGSKTRRTGA
jgi:hypothetical protein